MIRVLALVGALTAGMAYAGVSLAQTEEDPIIATVNGEAILNSDLTMFYDSLPQQYRQVPMVSLYDQLLEGLIESRLLAQEARKAGLLDDPTVKRRLAYITNDLLQRSYLDQLLAVEITEERMRALYEATIANQQGAEEVSARHILLEEEAAALEVIAELDKGVDFATLAQERSTGPSGPNGGDLGYFTREQMVAPFAEAAFALQPGEYTRQPVKTQFGWHVIKLENRRESPAPAYEESQAALSRQVGKEYTLVLMAKLLAGAEIERFDRQGNEADAAPAPAD